MSDPFDYLGSRDDADALIQEFSGGTTPNVSVRASTASGAKAWGPTLTPTDFPTFGVVIEYTTQQRDKDSNILETDQRALVAAGPLAGPNVIPTSAHSLVLADGSVAQIVKVTRLRPALVDLFYDCQIRQ